METLKRIDTILDSMKTEPLSYIVPMVMPIALECKDYQGYSLLAHWNCPLCDEVSANAVQREEIVSILIQEGLSKEDANELEFQATKQYMSMKSIGDGDILAHSVKEMEQWLSGYESVMSSPPYSKEKIVQLNERKKQIEQQYELLRSYIVSKLTSYRRNLKKKEDSYIMDYSGKSNTAKKKYQVFVSSTYSDLKEERAAVMQCLLEMNCIPVGMEQFPASNMNQMDYIRMMLDDCDYYVLVLAGRYGSLDTDGVGFTEKEYDYAIEHNIPVMSFVIDDIGKMVSSKCESTDLGREKLTGFRTKVCAGKLVKFYSDIGSLKAAVAVSLNRCIQDFPAVGWVRGNTSESTDKEDDLKTKVLQILEEHTISNEEINRLFEQLENDELVLDCGDASKNKKRYLSVENSGRFTFDYSNNDGKYTIGTGAYEFVTRWSKASDRSIHAYKDLLGANGAIARVKKPTGWPTKLDDGIDFSSRVRTPEIDDVIIWKNSYGKYAATRVVGIKDDSCGADHDELTCEYTIYYDTLQNHTACVESENVAGGHAVIIDDERYIAERVVEERDKEILSILNEI